MVLWTAGVISYRYKYALSWRLRNTRDHNQNPDQRVPFHIAKSGAGVPETGPNPGPRVPIYGIRETAVHAQTEPTGVSGESVVVLRPVVIEPSTDVFVPPLMPDGTRGAVQQGIKPTHFLGSHLVPTLVNYETQAIGDDLVIEVYRDTPDGAQDWAFGFGEPDHPLSVYFGNGDGGVEYPDLGILLSWGVSP